MTEICIMQQNVISICQSSGYKCCLEIAKTTSILMRALVSFVVPAGHYCILVNVMWRGLDQSHLRILCSIITILGAMLFSVGTVWNHAFAGSIVCWWQSY